MATKNQLDPTSVENQNLLYNLRFRWPQLSNYPDEHLVKVYNDFATSDAWGDNDENFLEYLDSIEVEK